MNVGKVNTMEKRDGGIYFLTTVHLFNVVTLEIKTKIMEFFLPCDNIDDDVVNATINRRDGVCITMLVGA